MKFYCSENNSFTSQSVVQLRCCEDFHREILWQQAKMQLPGDLQAMTMREALYKALNNVQTASMESHFWRYCLKLWHGGQRNSVKWLLGSGEAWFNLQKVLFGIFVDNSMKLWIASGMSKRSGFWRPANNLSRVSFDSVFILDPARFERFTFLSRFKVNSLK